MSDLGLTHVALPVADTLKRSVGGDRSQTTLDRAGLWAAQTPQVFRTELLLRLLERAEEDGFRTTDDAALHERYVGPVPLVPGERSNLKITTPEDLELARAILASRGAS